MKVKYNKSTKLTEFHSFIRHVWVDAYTGQILSDYYVNMTESVDDTDTIVRTHTDYLATFSEYGRYEVEELIKEKWAITNMEILYNNPEVDYTTWFTVER